MLMLFLEAACLEATTGDKNIVYHIDIAWLVYDKLAVETNFERILGKETIQHPQAKFF